MPTGVCAVAVVLTATAIAATRTSLVMNILWALPYLNSMHEKAWSSLTTVKSGKLSMVPDIRLPFRESPKHFGNLTGVNASTSGRAPMGPRRALDPKPSAVAFG
jgi:hypothetical protein